MFTQTNTTLRYSQARLHTQAVTQRGRWDSPACSSAEVSSRRLKPLLLACPVPLQVTMMSGPAAIGPPRGRPRDPPGATRTHTSLACDTVPQPIPPGPPCPPGPPPTEPNRPNEPTRGLTEEPGLQDQLISVSRRASSTDAFLDARQKNVGGSTPRHATPHHGRRGENRDFPPR